MAATIEHGNGFIRLILDSVDFNWDSTAITAGDSVGGLFKDLYPRGIALTGIKFYPSAVNDVLVVRDKSLTGTVITQIKSESGGVAKEYFYGDKLYKPFIEYDNLTLGTDTTAMIWLEFNTVPHT